MFCFMTLRSLFRLYGKRIRGEAIVEVKPGSQSFAGLQVGMTACTKVIAAMEKRGRINVYFGHRIDRMC